MEKLLKKVKEEHLDRHEQQDLLDNRMKLFYLIREYQKET